MPLIIPTRFYQPRGAFDPAASTPNLLTMEESAHNNSTSSISLTTSKTNNIIILDIQVNDATVTGVSGSTLGSFTARYNSGTPVISRFWALATATLSSETITMTISGSPTFRCMTVYAIHGANLVTPFDGSTVVDQTGVADPASITTTAANTMVLGAFRMASTGSPTAGTGFTGIQLNGDFFLSEYQSFSVPQSGLSVTIGTGANDSNGSIVDAIVSA